MSDSPKTFKKKLKLCRHFCEYCLIMFFYYLIRVLPRGAVGVIAFISGSFLYLIPPIRKLVNANVMAAFPEKESAENRRIARRSLINLIRSLLDFFWFVDKQKRLDKYVVYSDDVRDIADKYKQQGRGFIWVTPHLGNWELAGLKFKSGSGLPFAVVARKNPNPFLNNLVNSGRVSEGNIVIKAKGSIKEMMKALKKGYFMATLIDQNTRVRDGGIFVDFFGLPVPTSRAPALFARKVKTPVAVGGCLKRDDGKYTLFGYELSRPVEDYASDEEITQELMQITENLIRRYPDQYLWFYKRFQYIPKEADEEIKARYPYYAKVAPPRFYSKLAPKEESAKKRKR